VLVEWSACVELSRCNDWGFPFAWLTLLVLVVGWLWDCIMRTVLQKVHHWK
jgi:hypothetical protein